MASGFRVAEQTAYTAISSEPPGHVCGNAIHRAGNRKDSGALEGAREGKRGSIRTRQFYRAVRNNDPYYACHHGWTQQHLLSRRTRHREIPSDDSLSVNSNKPQAKTGPGSLWHFLNKTMLNGCWVNDLNHRTFTETHEAYEERWSKLVSRCDKNIILLLRFHCHPQNWDAGSLVSHTGLSSESVHGPPLKN